MSRYPHEPPMPVHPPYVKVSYEESPQPGFLRIRRAVWFIDRRGEQDVIAEEWDEPPNG